ncbi:MAG: lysophospholipid acyltransferase family protein [Bacilli bacterium]|jgi:1-acyl-sn-glycerol-3-phosphate acyltransferase|nr:lysophospholipid acyltransferase family protein [Bacilli bacterium]MDD3389185.1 lysophospholipid acyltransferase family protein [Bacilli bacterium]MDD4344974.1 lysophospholipid acyltransferase family protein [Bacilli bacterium]MDD4521151.1 lysophospholipid acyltransferase family protein [Bacilli bacterium]MDY0399918.1 lysophospholipid acyltransferase family protein [Bacilli bacterium]
MNYRHQLNFNYPDQPDAHMIDPKLVRNIPLNRDYPYYRNRWWDRVKLNIFQVLFMLIAVPICTVRHGIRIFGKRAFRKNKSVYKNGYISICNHVFDWDYMAVRSALKWKRGFITIWKNNNNRSLGPLFELIGGVPVPDNMDGTMSFTRALHQMMQDKRNVHFYPEASMWYYYQGLRPFKKGAFSLACHTNKPIVPMAITFRPARGIYKLWKRNGYPCSQIAIGKPLFPKEDLPLNQRVSDLLERSYQAVKALQEKYTPKV